MTKDRKTLLSDPEFNQQRAEAMGGTFVLSFPRSFTDEQIAELRGLVEYDSSGGTVEGQEANAIRRSSVHWLDPKQYRWVYDELKRQIG